MKQKRCKSPKHVRVYNEADDAFRLGFCTCGVILEDVPPAAVLPETPAVPAAPAFRSPQPSAADLSPPSPRASKAKSARATGGSGDPRPKRGSIKPKPAKLPPEAPLPSAPREQATALAPGNGPLLRIVDPEGRDWRTVRLVHDQIVVGRSSSKNLPPDLDVAPVDPGHVVSHEHLLVFCQGGNWHVRALSARSGTYVNSEPLAANQDRKLASGDQIVLGADNGIGLLFEYHR